MTSTFSNAIASFGINSGASGTYATVHSGNNLGVANFGGGSVTNTYDGVNYAITRVWLHFDTTIIPTGSRIVSAFIRFPGTATITGNADSDTLEIVSSSVTSTTTLATGDWNNLGTTSLGALAFSGWSTSTNNDVSLNSTGLAAVTTAGITKLAGRTLKDINATTPTGGTGVSFTAGSVLLSVTYDPPGGGVLAAFL